MAALRYREKTGEGQHVELAMIEGEFQVLGDAYIDYALNGRERHRAGNDHPVHAPHDVFPCNGDDAWVAIAIETDDQWRALCTVIGRTELAADPRYATAAERIPHRRDFAAILSPWTSARTAYECQAALQSAGIPAAAVLNAIEVIHDPHVVARHGYEWVETPNVGRNPYPRVGFVLDGTPIPVAGPAPGFGANIDEIIGGLLGYSAEEIAALESRGVIAREPRDGAE